MHYNTKDTLIYNKGVGLVHSFFSDMFYIKQIRKGVHILATKSHEECHYELGNYYEHHSIDFKVYPIKGKKLDKNNSLICEGDVNVIDICDSYSRLVLGWRPRCILTLLVPLGSKIGYSIDVLKFNYNTEEIDKYEEELQIEKYKEEIKAIELKKALKQVARQRLIEEGVLFDEEHKRPYIPQDVVGQVYLRDGGRCCECGSTKNLQLDHIIPFSKGGSSEPENLRLLCKECNLKKGDRI